MFVFNWFPTMSLNICTLVSHCNVIVLLAILSLFLLCFPLVFINSNDVMRKNIFETDTVLAITLKNSEKLRTSHACCIAVVLPMAVDLLMDYYLKLKGIAISAQWNDRFILSLSIVIPSLAYLFFCDSAYITCVYVILFYAQFIGLAAVTSYSVLSDFKKKSKYVLPNTLYLVFFLHCLKSCLRVYAFLFGAGFNEIADMLVMIVCALLYFNVVYWWYKTLQFPKESKKCTEDEYRCAIYMMVLPLYSIWAVVSAILWPFKTWQETSEPLLVSYVIGQVILTIVVSVLPGRITRMNAIVNMEMLALKQVFVRYISHEIRSPLNVVHAGLDLLRSELQSVASLSRSTLELVEDIFTSSESAINILNDLLSYEYIDAGIFDLELSYKPLMQLFEGQLQWAELLAKSSGISFIIVDETVSTESGVQGCVSRMLSETILDFCPEESDVLFEQHVQNLSLANAYVRIDEHKIEQVIRNLVSNAIKATPTTKSVSVKISHRDSKSMIPLVTAKKLTTENASGYLRVEVTDSGGGFAAADQEKAFGEFSQFKHSELEGEGKSGLSLWLSRRIIDMHQGRMGVTSAGVGLGSTYYFEIPLYLMSDDVDSSSSCRRRSFRRKLSDIAFDCPQILRQEWNLPVKRDDASNYSGATNQEGVQVTDCISESIHEDSTLKRVGCMVDFQISSVVEDERNDTDAHLNSGTNLVEPPSIPAAKRDIEIGYSDDSTSFEGSTKKINYFLDASLSNHAKVHPTSASLQKERHAAIYISKKKLQHPQNTSHPDKKPLQILIVDDSGLNRKIVRKILESAPELIPSNSCIYEADDGTTAIAEMKNLLAVGTTMDIVLIDFVMIAMNGPEAVKIMREKLHFHGVVIGITGNALQEDVATFLQQGADQILIKPITKSKLLDSLYSFKDRFIANRFDQSVEEIT
mmetsp:Transcript_17069/g.23459  ORF Transcript_17069/g.23459 Transcript_17069/m.23459 type:complete len:922 (+) Transcript_17069:41-2806(+)